MVPTVNCRSSGLVGRPRKSADNNNLFFGSPGNDKYDY